MPNRLIHQSSHYLQQHANNPVEWYPYGEEAFTVAAAEKKPVLISIGYSSCHWCHVMEHESFSDTSIAEQMNRDFICIKVDREERPDVDHYYMEAVQRLTGQGGWPLNCFALPDGRPFWGGTYFKPEQWNFVLDEISRLFKESPTLLEQQAQDLEKNSISRQLLSIKSQAPVGFSANIERAARNLESLFDREFGGIGNAPKFPMPVVWEWVLMLSASGYQDRFGDILSITLDAMARGGIYDQAGGGFARYSTDRHWKVPHFEKMLYDNAQLLGLYADAYRLQPGSELMDIVKGVGHFLLRDMVEESGVFKSSVDADSEMQEGKYYTWSPDEFNEALGHYSELAAEYFGIGAEGSWEGNTNILLRPHENALFAQRHFLSATELEAFVAHCRKLLFEARQKRVAPYIDPKVIVSWNALAIRGLIKAFWAIEDEKLLTTAIKAAGFIRGRMTSGTGQLFRIWDGREVRVPAFLDDYTLLADAYTELFSATLDTKWLESAVELVEWSVSQFFDNESGLFHYSPSSNTTLRNHFETHDQVIPSSNAVMARVLFKLGVFIGKDEWVSFSERMVAKVGAHAEQYPAAHAAWLQLILESKEFRVVAIVGGDAAVKIRKLQSRYLPAVFIAGTITDSKLPYFRGRFHEGKTLIYVCSGNSCLPPVESVEEAIHLISS